MVPEQECACAEHVPFDLVDRASVIAELAHEALEAVPDADKSIRVGVPQFRWRIRALVSVGSAKRHVSLCVMCSNALYQERARLAGYDHTHTVVRFKPDVPIPADLVIALVRARQAEIGKLPKEQRRLVIQ